MSNLNNLTSKIISDAELKAKEIIDNAKKEENKILNEERAEAEAKKNAILKKAEFEAKAKKERILSSTSLEIRNNKLKAKQEIIDNVFKNALSSLNNLPNGEYEKFVKNYIISLDISGDEKIIQNKDNKISHDLLENINSALKAKGKKGQLSLENEKRNIGNGFILYKNGIEINCTFEALVLSVRDELENDVVSALFD